MDKLIKLSIIAVSQQMFGAKVEIEKLHLALLKGQLTILNYTAGNKKLPFTNVLSFKKAEFEINTGALFSKQVYIRKAGISGVEFGTARKTSAVLKVKKQKMNILTKEINKQTQVAKDYYSLESIGNRLQLDTITDFSNFKFLEKVNQSVASVNKWPADFALQISSPDVSIILNNIEKRWQILQNSFPKSIDKLTAYAKDIDSLNIEISLLNQYIEQRKNIYDSNTKYWNKLIADLNQQADMDLKGLQNKIRQIEAKKNTAMQEIIGPRYVAYMEIARGYLARAQKMLPAKKIAQKKWYESWQVKGENIEFPIYEHRPSFLLEKLYVKGNLKNLSFLGEINEIASDQKVRNIPTTFKMYTVDNKSQKAGIDGYLDLRNGVDTNIKAFFLGFPLATNYWDESTIPLHIAGGTYDLIASLSFAKNSFSLGSDINTAKTVFVKSPSYSGDNLVHQLLWKLAEISPVIKMHSEYREGNLALDTNLDEALKKVYEQELEQKKKQLLDELAKQWDKNVDSKLRELNASYKALEKQIGSDLENQKQELNKELKRISQELESKKKEISDLQKKLGQQLDTEKQRIIIELEQKKQAEELRIKQQLEEKAKLEEQKLQKKLREEFDKVFKL